MSSGCGAVKVVAGLRGLVRRRLHEGPMLSCSVSSLVRFFFRDDGLAITSKKYGIFFLATTLGPEGSLGSLRTTSRLVKEGEQAIGISSLGHSNVHISLILLSVMSRIAAEGEVNVNGSIPWLDDVARTIEVYQARVVHLLAQSLHALRAYMVALLLRCGATYDDIEHQGNDILVIIGYVDTSYRRSVWYLNRVPGHWQLGWEVDIKVDVVFDS